MACPFELLAKSSSLMACSMQAITHVLQHRDGDTIQHQLVERKSHIPRSWNNSNSSLFVESCFSRGTLGLIENGKRGFPNYYPLAPGDDPMMDVDV
jgi:hypothetical protein